MSDTFRNKEHYAFKNRVGEKYFTNEGYEIEIIEYMSSENCTIKFNDQLYIRNILYDSIKRGSVKNPYHPSVYGIGYLGEGKYKSKIDGVTTKFYSVWFGVIQRGYCKNFKNRNTSYKECNVNKSWHNFQVFAEWYEKNYKPYMEKWHLDKDILVKSNKIYSPETCCFVPQEINKLFTKSEKTRGDCPIGVKYSKRREKYLSSISINKRVIHLGAFGTPQEAFLAYKTAKEAYIKEVANEWKDKISEKVYQALINYQVEITD